VLASGYLSGEEGGIGIHCDPGIEHKFGVGRWDWMDGFMPDNERRKEWLGESHKWLDPVLLPLSAYFPHPH
jgi:hypothetical protein